MKKPARRFAANVFFLALVTLVVQNTQPAVASDYEAVDLNNFHMTVLGQDLNGHQSITLAAVVVSLLCCGFLFQRVIMRECSCYCGPGKCECGCGCNNRCPCYYRDKSAHNDHARYQHYN